MAGKTPPISNKAFWSPLFACLLGLTAPAGAQTTTNVTERFVAAVRSGAEFKAGTFAAAAQPTDNIVSRFLNAADVGDRTAMAALISKRSAVSPKALFKKIESCYLRRVYGNGSEIIAVWMCDEGADRSRVLLVNVAADGGGVLLRIAGEQTNARPAPPRTGSALASEP